MTIDMTTLLATSFRKMFYMRHQAMKHLHTNNYLTDN